MSEPIPAEFRRFPKRWAVVPFLEAVADATSGNGKVQQRDYLESGRLPVIDQGQRLVAGYTDDPDSQCHEASPAILFGDHTREFKFVDFPFALGADGVKVLRPIADLDKRFLYHYLRQLRLPDDQGYSRHYKFLKRTFVPVPPLPEQKRIAAILDKAGAIRRKRQDAIRLTEEALRSAFLEMFGDPVANPKGWDVRRLEELVDKDRGISYGVVQRGRDVPDGVPVVRIGNFVGNIFDPSTVVRTAPEIAGQYKRTFLRGGEVVVSIRGTCGRVAVVPPSAAGWNVTREVAVVPLKSEVNAHFVRRVALSPGGQHFILGNVRGIAQRGINLADLRNLPVPMPPRSEMHKFDKLRGLHEAYSSHLTDSLAGTASLVESLTQRAFSGRLQ